MCFHENFREIKKTGRKLKGNRCQGSLIQILHIFEIKLVKLKKIRKMGVFDINLRSGQKFPIPTENVSDHGDNLMLV